MEQGKPLVGLPPSHRVFQDDYISETAPRFLRNSPGWKTGKSLEEDLYTFQKGRERVYNYKVSKVKLQEKGRQKEMCPRFSQAEENVMPTLARPHSQSLLWTLRCFGGSRWTRR